MAFDFKKECKELYMPKAKPEIVTVPAANYIAVKGRGDPNEKEGAYQRAIRLACRCLHPKNELQKRLQNRRLF